MVDDSFVVVGDRFQDFLDNQRTISVTALLSRLRAGAVSSDLTIVVGQGISADQLATLNQLACNKDNPISVYGDVPAHVEPDLTHKREFRNIMIGTPKRAAKTSFVADLVIDDDNEVLEDHLTGQHIPAIALVEAARQTWTAVTERFLLTEGTRPVRFVIATMRCAFHRFVFPLPATMHYELLGHRQDAVEQVFDCLVTVRQSNAVAAEVETSYRVISAAISEKQESMAARQAVAGYLDHSEVVANEKIA